MRNQRTKIHDHPSSPAVPDMKDIANARRPEKAPASVAPPQNRPSRVWSMCRGYHMERLFGGRQGYQFTDNTQIKPGNILEEYTWCKTSLRNPKADACSNQLWIAWQGRTHEQKL